MRWFLLFSCGLYGLVMLIFTTEFEALRQPYGTGAEYIFYGASQNQDTEIYRINPDGRGRINVSNNPAYHDTIIGVHLERNALVVIAEHYPDPAYYYYLYIDGTVGERFDEMPSDLREFVDSPDRQWLGLHFIPTSTIEAETGLVNTDTDSLLDQELFIVQNAESNPYKGILSVRHYTLDELGTFTAMRQLTLNDENDYFDSWSPDQAWVLYTRSGVDGIDLYKARTQGPIEEIRLTTHPGNDYLGRWAYYHDWIIFISERSGHPEMYRMNAEGSDIRQLTDDKLQTINNLTWLPLRQYGYHRSYLLGLAGICIIMGIGITRLSST